MTTLGCENKFSRLRPAVVLPWLAGIWLATLLPAALLAVEARAQNSAKEDSVLSRAQSNAEALGIDLFSTADEPGAPFALYPSLAFTSGYDDNIFFDDSGTEDSFFFIVRPEAVVSSDWDNHALNVGAFGEFGRYVDNGNSNYDDWEVFADGVIDIDEESRLFGRGSWGRFHNTRDDPDTASGDFDVDEYFRSRGNVGVEAKPADLLLRLEGRFTDINYRDNESINNDDRDRREYLVTGRVGYEFQPGVAVFVEPSYEWVNFDDDVDDFGIDRDNDGVSVVGGFVYELTGVTFVEAGLGYFHRNYDDSDFNDRDGIDFTLRLTWNPTDLLTVDASGGRVVSQTSLDGASGAVTSFADLTFDYELAEGLVLSPSGAFRNDDFGDNERDDDTYLARLGLTYFLNDQIRIEASYEFSHRDSNVGGEDYDRNVAMITMTGKL